MKQTVFRVYVVGGSVSITGSVSIVFPTAPVSVSENINAQIAVPTGVATQLAVASATRSLFQFVNDTGTPLYVKLGAGASATDYVVPVNATFTLVPDNLGRIYTGQITVFQNSGAGVNVPTLQVA